MRREHPDVFEVPLEGPPELQWPAEPVIEALSPLVTPRRLERIESVATARTFDVIPVLEHIADPHNASAILRSADAFGIQRVHVIPHELGFHAARGVSMGTHRWLDIEKHRNAASSAAALKRDGFRLMVADMHGDLLLDELATTAKVAIVVGNEHHGPSQEIRDLADGTFAVPMRGFVESLNVSVAAAIALFHATRKRTPIEHVEQRKLIARYLLSSVRDAERVVREHLS